MIRLIALILSLIVLPIPAVAQNDLSLCKLRAQHMARSDVAYQPGIDIHGKPVVPADVNAVAPALLPDVVKIPVSIDLAQRLGHVPAGVELKTEVGMIEVHRDGRVTYDGYDLTQQTNAVCGEGNMTDANPVDTASDLPPQTLGQLTVADTPSEAAKDKRSSPVNVGTTTTNQQNDIIWGEGY